jgi:hypothetical protein
MGFSHITNWFITIGLSAITIGIIFLGVGIYQFSKHDEEMKLLEKLVTKVVNKNK